MDLPKQATQFGDLGTGRIVWFDGMNIFIRHQRLDGYDEVQLQPEHFARLMHFAFLLVKDQVNENPPKEKPQPTRGE